LSATAQPLTPLLITRIGLESVGSPGRANATMQWPSIKKATPQPQTIGKPHGVSGSFRHRKMIPEEEFTRFSFDIEIDYRTLGHILAGLYGCGSETYQAIAGTGSNGFDAGAFVHRWNTNSQVAPILQYLTLQCGFIFPDSADNIIHEYQSVFFDGLTLNTTRGSNANSITCTVTAIGKKRVATPSPNTFDTGDNTTYLLDLTGATGGTFVYTTPDFKSTAALAFDITAANLQTALRAAGMYNGAVVTVTLSGTVYTITLISTLANTKTGLPRIDNTSLTGTPATVTYKKATDGHKLKGGSAEYEFNDVKANEVSVYYATLADILLDDGGFDSDAKLLANFTSNIALTGINKEHFVQNDSETSYAFAVPQGVDAGRKEGVSLTARWLDEGIQFWDDWRNEADKYWGIRCNSADVIVSGGTTTFRIRMYGKVIVMKIGDYQDSGAGVTVIPTDLEFADDDNNALKALFIEIINDIPTYAVA
jgi:hypothetical protein